MTTVVVGLIERLGRILICRRKSNQKHPGKWEFPGGKVNHGEIPVDALRRELREELEIKAEIGQKITQYCYRYPGLREIELIFFYVEKFQGDLNYEQFEAMLWVLPEDLHNFDFLEGDIDFICGLAAGNYD